MKKFILLLGLLFCMCACAGVEKDFRVTIVYTIDGGEPKTETITMSVPDGYYPTYVYDGNMLRVFGIRGNMASFYQHTVYQGSLKIEVQSFDYTEVRSYTVSKIDGHEIKKK